MRENSQFPRTFCIKQNHFKATQHNACKNIFNSALTLKMHFPLISSSVCRRYRSALRKALAMENIILTFSFFTGVLSVKSVERMIEDASRNRVDSCKSVSNYFYSSSLSWRKIENFLLKHSKPRIKK